MDQETYNDLRNLLLACNELQNDEWLASLFIVDGLDSFANALSTASSKFERVDKLIFFLTNNELSSGEILLPSFLEFLQIKYKNNEKIYIDISNLLPNLKNASTQKEKNKLLSIGQPNQSVDYQFQETESKFLNALEKELRMKSEKYFPNGVFVQDANYWAILYFPEQIKSNQELINEMNDVLSNLKQNKDIDTNLRELGVLLKLVRNQCLINCNLLDEALRVDIHHRLGKTSRACLADILDQWQLVYAEYTSTYGQLVSLSSLISETVQLRLLLSNLNRQFEKISMDLRQFV